MEKESESTFFIRINHDFRSQLNNIIGFSELAQLDEIPQKTREYLKNIFKSAESLSETINSNREILPELINASKNYSDLPSKQISQDTPKFNGEILICEDSQMNRMVICEYLSRVGLNVTEAENGKEGIDIVKKRLHEGQKPFDLIFMDIYMPITDGMEAASQIIAMGVKTPIVAITTSSSFSDSEQYKKHGMVSVLSKPFKSQELWECLKIYLPELST